MVIKHVEPIFRGNYYSTLEVNFISKLVYKYDDNYKEFLAFKDGMEIGVLDSDESLYALSLCGQDSDKVKVLIKHYSDKK